MVRNTEDKTEVRQEERKKKNDQTRTAANNNTAEKNAMHTDHACSTDSTTRNKRWPEGTQDRAMRGVAQSGRNRPSRRMMGGLGDRGKKERKKEEREKGGQANNRSYRREKTGHKEKPFPGPKGMMVGWPHVHVHTSPSLRSEKSSCAHSLFGLVHLLPFFK